MNWLITFLHSLGLCVVVTCFSLVWKLTCMNLFEIKSTFMQLYSATLKAEDIKKNVYLDTPLSTGFLKSVVFLDARKTACHAEHDVWCFNRAAYLRKQDFLFNLQPDRSNHVTVSQPPPPIMPKLQRNRKESQEPMLAADPYHINGRGWFLRREEEPQTSL